MTPQQYFLKPNVMLEPLVDGWYAWSHLIPPATAARNLTERHLVIMDSYIDSPESHAAAARNPALLGGPFMDFSSERVEEVKQLRDETIKKRSSALALSHAIEELDQLLREKAAGHSLEPLYEEIPQELQGYVELVYDLNNHPSFRLIEPLLYRSPYYEEFTQSLLLSEVPGDDRPFVLSTPRVEREGTVELKVPFSSTVIDSLFELQHEPASYDAICEMLDLNGEQRERFRSFLTTEPPKPYQAYEGPGVRWRYFGHACILLETANISILLDPVLSYTYKTNISRYTYEDLPPAIDYVLITHNHPDHILFETLLQLRHRIRHIVAPGNNGGSLQDPSLRLLLEQCGFRHVIELAEMQEILSNQVKITALPFLGEHGDLNVQSKAAWHVEFHGHKLLFAADSCNLSPKMYEHIHSAIGNIDALFVGMECNGAPMSWIYGPLLTQRIDRKQDHSRRLAGSDYDRAKAIVDQFQCKEVYVYAMGQEPWLNYVMSVRYTEASKPIMESNKLLDYCQSQGIIAKRLYGEKEILLSGVPKRVAQE